MLRDQEVGMGVSVGPDLNHCRVTYSLSLVRFSPDDNNFSATGKSVIQWGLPTPSSGGWPGSEECQKKRTPSCANFIAHVRRHFPSVIINPWYVMLCWRSKCSTDIMNDRLARPWRSHIERWHIPFHLHRAHVLGRTRLQSRSFREWTHSR